MFCKKLEAKTMLILNQMIHYSIYMNFILNNGRNLWKNTFTLKTYIYLRRTDVSNAINVSGRTCGTHA